MRFCIYKHWKCLLTLSFMQNAFFSIPMGAPRWRQKACGFHLSRLGIHAQLLTDPGEQLWCANYAQPDDLFITFSIWGKYKNVASCFRRAQTAGAKTAAFYRSIAIPACAVLHACYSNLHRSHVYLTGHTFSSIVETDNVGLPVYSCRPPIRFQRQYYTGANGKKPQSGTNRFLRFTANGIRSHLGNTGSG